jgi:hypothetical protein
MLDLNTPLSAIDVCDDPELRRCLEVARMYGIVLADAKLAMARAADAYNEARRSLIAAYNTRCWERREIEDRATRERARSFWRAIGEPRGWKERP